MKRFVIIYIFFILFFSFSIKAQQIESYSKDEINLKLELMEEKINAHMFSLSREDKGIDIKIAAQDRMIVNQDKQLEGMKYLFGILLSILTIITASVGVLIDKRNQERTKELEEELKLIREEANKQLEHITEIARLEVHMARVELKEIKMESNELIKNLKEKSEIEFKKREQQPQNNDVI